MMKEFSSRKKMKDTEAVVWRCSIEKVFLEMFLETYVPGSLF